MLQQKTLIACRLMVVVLKCVSLIRWNHGLHNSLPCIFPARVGHKRHIYHMRLEGRSEDAAMLFLSWKVRVGSPGAFVAHKSCCLAAGSPPQSRAVGYIHSTFRKKFCCGFSSAFTAYFSIFKCVIPLEFVHVFTQEFQDHLLNTLLFPH